MCAADLHLGRQVGLASEQSYVIKAWENLIDATLAHTPPIDALLLAGDVIDGDDLFIEMYGVLKKGIKRLLERGIQVIAIAGNHDPEVLRQIRDSLELPGFHLLGTKGRWERLSTSFRGQTIHIDGISFRSPFFETNPLEIYDLEKVAQGEVLIGLLHCDVDVSESRYAPVRTIDFQRMDHSAWFLGHIHIPKAIGKNIHYCGSLQGLDVSETGAHGALLLSIQSNGKIEIQQKPLAPLRFEKMVVDFSDLSLDGFGPFFEKIEAELKEKMKGEEGFLDKIGLRLILRGRTPLFREIRKSLFKLQEQEGNGVSLNGKWIPYFIESIQNETRPTYDLKRLGEGNDFVAALARQLLLFDQNEPFEHMEKVFQRDAVFKQVEESWLTKEECASLYLSKGYELLDELLRQKQENL